MTIVACVLLAGCGGPGELSPAEREQARGTLLTYGHALVDRDSTAACATLTKRMRGRYAPDCRRGIEAMARRLDADEPLRVRVQRTLLPNDAADAVIEYGSPPGTSGGQVFLRREGGRWLIDEDLSCVTPGCDP